MKEIRPEHTPYIYFTRAEGIPKTRVVAYYSGDELWHINLGAYAESLPSMERFLANNEDIRLVLIPSFFRPGFADVHYLFWSDGTDLAALDSRVVSGTYSELEQSALDAFGKLLMAYVRDAAIDDCDMVLSGKRKTRGRSNSTKHWTP